MRIRFDSSLDNVDHAAAAIRDWCEARDWPPNLISQIELVVVEALTNVIVHAYDQHAGQPIEVCWWPEHRRLLIEIRDKGQPIIELPPGELPDPEAESGRGWYIIRALVESIDYRRELEENVLLLGKTIDAA